MQTKPLLQVLIWLLTVAIVVPLGCSTQREADVEAAMTAVDEIWQRYSSSLNSGDIDAWIALWTDDGIQMPPNSPPVVGKDQIRERNKGVLDQFSFDIGITNEEVGVAGDWAYARGTYTASLTPKNGGEAIFIDGKYMTIFGRQPDGSWKIHRDIFNSNLPPPES
jgi:uncharacterized protein (TIGR02246 family)